MREFRLLNETLAVKEVDVWVGLGWMASDRDLDR